MDWLDEKLERIKFEFINLSLRKALAGYIISFILMIALLSLVTLLFCDRWDKFIWSQYAHAGSDALDVYMVYYDETELSELDRILVNLIDFLQTWSVFFYSIAGIIGVSYLFYHNKLKEPLRILKEATDQLGKNNLKSSIHYASKDEMGDLCHSFDLMRKQLISNNQKMWDMMEEQRRLNSAFAHDLRTPLTVLRGYTDFLNKYIPEGKIKEEKLTATLIMMSNQLQRLERYCNTMKNIDSLEEMPVHKEEMDIQLIYTKIEQVAAAFVGEKSIILKLDSSETKGKVLFLDEGILMEVFENLISNAIRYAVSKIEVTLTYSLENNQVYLAIADDGIGFSAKDLLMVTKPYYTNGNKSEHFGIGLYICKLLCEKHGGWITLTNSINHGAIATAAFSADSK